jgi:uncharacterized membrane protein
MQVLTRAINTEGPDVQPAPTWRVALSGVLAVLGLGLSVYLTITHFAHVVPFCSNSGAINCLKVTTSPQSYVFGIPVAVLGLAYYAVMSVVNSPWAWRSSDRRVHLARLVLSVLGMGFVLYLISAELLIIKAICLYCTGVHVVTFFQLILVMATVPTMLGWGQRPAPEPRRGRRPATNRSRRR